MLSTTKYEEDPPKAVEIAILYLSSTSINLPITLCIPLNLGLLSIFLTLLGIELLLLILFSKYSILYFKLTNSLLLEISLLFISFLLVLKSLYFSKLLSISVFITSIFLSIKSISFFILLIKLFCFNSSSFKLNNLLVISSSAVTYLFLSLNTRISASIFSNSFVLVIYSLCFIFNLSSILLSLFFSFNISTS